MRQQKYKKLGTYHANQAGKSVDFNRVSTNQFITAYLNRHIQIMQYFLKLNAFPVIVFIAESGPNPLQDKLRSTIQRDGQAISR